MMRGDVVWFEQVLLMCRTLTILFFRAFICASAQISSATATSLQRGTRPLPLLQNRQQQIQVLFKLLNCSFVQALQKIEHNVLNQEVGGTRQLHWGKRSSKSLFINKQVMIRHQALSIRQYAIGMALRLMPCFAGAHMFAYSAFPATARPLVILKDEEPLGVTRATPLMVNAPTWNTGNPP